MKVFKPIVLIIALLITIFGLQSCEDPCLNVTCENGGGCIEGTCECPLGFSGTNCEIEDPCHNTTCENGGTCLDGACDCPDGYSGDSCEVENRAKFIGNYDVSENCTTDDYEYSMSVTASNDAVNEIHLIGLYELTIALDATISGDSLHLVPGQSHSGEFESIEGGGSISGNVVTIVYTIMNHGASDNCTTTLTKQ